MLNQSAPPFDTVQLNSPLRYLTLAYLDASGLRLHVPRSLAFESKDQHADLKDIYSLLAGNYSKQLHD